MVYLVVVLVLVALAVAAAVVMRNRRSTAAATAAVAAPPAPTSRLDEPMTGLESALAEVTGRDGRPIGEKIDAEAQHVDDLRVTDDTGPLLRRALDHVEHHDEHHDGHGEHRADDHT